MTVELRQTPGKRRDSERNLMPISFLWDYGKHQNFTYRLLLRRKSLEPENGNNFRVKDHETKTKSGVNATIPYMLPLGTYG